MVATQTLPPSYRLASTVDVSKNQSLLLMLNIVGLFLMGVFGFLFFRLMYSVRPYDTLRSFNIQFGSIPAAFGLIAVIFALTVLNVLLHEGIHGVFFWLFTRARPRFAFKVAYAYASAPSWYIQRAPFLITTLAPLIIISLVGALLFLVIPASWLMATWFVIITNASGAVGDLLVAYRLLKCPASCLVQDRGDAVSFFVPG